MNLHELLLNEGSRLPFRQELSDSRIAFPSLVEFEERPVGEGFIENAAGSLTLRGCIRSRMRCICDRCAAEFSCTGDIPLEIPLAVDPEDEEDPDYFPLRGDDLDLADLLETAFILNTASRSLCREDCKGLCSKCGVNLNEGPCSCRKECDPRLAVLEQLLENKD